MLPVTVWAYAFEGYSTSLAQFFGSGPKFRVTCGKCRGGFVSRIQMVDYPIVVCPCGTPNKLNVVIK